LLGFIARHDAQAVEVTGIVPADSPVRVLLAEPGRMEIVPHLMFRIVDVSGFFGAIRTKDEVSGFFTMRVHDRTCEWNDKVFAVSVDGGRASASPALLSDADITLDISALSQIASGYMPAASSARAGLLQVSDARAVSMLQEIFPARATFCADYF
jgi:predicted acetyltransferase